jgi:hypothetical protein
MRSCQRLTPPFYSLRFPAIRYEPVRFPKAVPGRTIIGAVCAALQENVGFWVVGGLKDGVHTRLWR